MTKSRIHIGTSGFSYKDWLGNFYPQFCPPADFLQFYSSQFQTVEIDSSFYRIPSDKMIDRWKLVTPEKFVFSAKFPRTVTHEGELKSRLAEAGRFIEAMRRLDHKLGPLLLQFPYGFKPQPGNVDMLMALLDALPDGLRFSVELRHKGWLKLGEVLDRFEQQGIAYCLIDHPWMPRTTTATADFQYIRLLGDRKKIEADFSHVRVDRESDLDWWRQLVSEAVNEGRQVFVYVNNHYSGHSPTTAQRFKELVAR